MRRRRSAAPDGRPRRRAALALAVLLLGAAQVATVRIAAALEPQYDEYGRKPIEPDDAAAEDQLFLPDSLLDPDWIPEPGDPDAPPATLEKGETGEVEPPPRDQEQPAPEEDLPPPLPPEIESAPLPPLVPMTPAPPE